MADAPRNDLIARALRSIEDFQETVPSLTEAELRRALELEHRGLNRQRIVRRAIRRITRLVEDSTRKQLQETYLCPAKHPKS